MPVSAWSTTADSNGSTLGIDIAENCDAANINNAQREMMAQIKTKFDAIDTTISGLAIDPTLTALGGLTTAANEMIYATGVDTFAMTTLSSFARTLLDDGDAATALATLGALGFVSVSFGSNSVAVSIKLNSSNTLLLQAGTVTVGANSDGTITFGTAYSTAPVCIVSGGPVGSGDAGSIHTQGVAGTTSQAVSNTSGGSLAGSWLAIGKA